MKKIIVGPPFMMAPQSLFTFFLLLLGNLLLIASSVYIALTVESLYQKIGAILAAIFFLVGIPSLIWVRNKNLKQNVIFDKDGVKLKDNEEIIEISWDDIESMKFTYVFEEINNRKYGFPFLLIKTKSTSFNHDVSFTHHKSTFPFIMSSKYFEKYFGFNNDFNLAINIENVDENKSKALLTDYPLKPERTRPLMKVSSKDEYNKLIEETCGEEEQKEYKLE